MSQQFLRFCVVGAAGFLVDAGILAILTGALGWNNIIARVPSFLIAVFTTWRLNRRLTFPHLPSDTRRSSLREFANYLSVGLAGNLLNFWIYSALILTILARQPIVALAVASLVALVFSYFGYSAWVFSRKSNQSSTSDKSPSEPTARIP